MQRDRRKELEATGDLWIPRFFEQIDSAVNPGETIWSFKNNYWQNRGKFENDLDPFA
jgi:hypothetical protein